MSNDNGGIPPQGQQPPAYPGVPVPPQPPAYPGAGPQQPPQPAYPGSTPPAPVSPGAAPAAPGYAAPGYAAPGYGAPGSAAPGYAAPTYAQPYGAPYPTPMKSNGLAIASLICGIIALVFCWGYLVLPLLAGIPAVITGHLALKKVKSDPTLGGKGLALTGLITGYVGIGLGLIIGAFFVIFIIAATTYTGTY